MPLPRIIPLHSLFEEGRFIEHPVCHDGQAIVRWAEFAGQVSWLSEQLEAREEARWLLACDAPHLFAIRLFALLHAGKQVVIPPNSQPGTLAALAGAFDARFEEAQIEPGSAQANLPALDPHAAIIDLYTSGSTGEPKQVRKTLAQFEAEVAVLEAQWGSVLGDAAIVSTVPHQHIYGLLFRLLWPLSAGRIFDTVTCAHPDMLEERLALLGECAVISSPAHLARMPDLLPLSDLDPQPNVIYSSGGPLPSAVAIEFFQQLGQAPIEVFGSTETGGIAWRRQEGAPGADLWSPFPLIDVSRSERGALLLRSPFLGTEERREMDDEIELMPDGRFRLLGRLDRIVKIEEKRLSLPDMELRLIEHPWVETCAVVALSGRRQSIGAVLVLNAMGHEQLGAQGNRAFKQILRKYLAAYFEAVLLPRHWRFQIRLPFNERGKITYSALQALFSTEVKAPLFPQVLRAQRSPGVDNEVLLDLHITSSIEHFAGHFPGFPILPGVVQIDWAVRYAREYFAVNGNFEAVDSLKFQAIILPDAKLQLSLKWNQEKGRLEFFYADAQRKYTAGRILFGVIA